MKISIVFSALLTLVVLICIPALLHAQPGVPGGQPTPAPFDGGLSLILAAGAGYAIKKRYDHRKKIQAEQTDSINKS